MGSEPDVSCLVTRIEIWHQHETLVVRVNCYIMLYIGINAASSYWRTFSQSLNQIGIFLLSTSRHLLCI
jgi:hypothetical protein